MNDSWYALFNVAVAARFYGKSWHGSCVLQFRDCVMVHVTNLPKKFCKCIKAIETVVRIQMD